MVQILERIQAHYESREMAFGKVYVWCPAHVALECDCGERLIITATSTITGCPCGARLGGFVHYVQEHEDHLPDRLTHPWFHDAQSRAQQRLRDETTYPEGSPWRYNDVTAGNG